MLAVVVLQTAATLAALELPDLNAAIIDQGVATGDAAIIWRLGLLMLAVAAVHMICTAIAIYLGARLSMSLGAYLREQMFLHIHGFASQDFHAFGASSLITRSTNDVQQIQTTTMMTFSVMIGAPIMGIGGVIMALRQDVQLSLILVVLVPLLALVIGLIMSRLSPPLLHPAGAHRPNEYGTAGGTHRHPRHPRIHPTGVHPRTLHGRE